MLQLYERIGSHVGVKQCAVPVVSFAAVEHQTIAHRGKRLTGAREKLREQHLSANVPLLSVGPPSPLNHLGTGELIVEEISLILVSVGGSVHISGDGHNLDCAHSTLTSERFSDLSQINTKRAIEPLKLIFAVA
jgi:hypothetical protein